MNGGQNGAGTAFALTLAGTAGAAAPIVSGVASPALEPHEGRSDVVRNDFVLSVRQVHQLPHLSVIQNREISRAPSVSKGSSKRRAAGIL